MDRSIAYTQEQARSTDFLFAQRATMIGLGKLAKAVFGTQNLVEGLAVAPTSPASMSVAVGIGQIYSMQPVDASAYGVLPADTVDTILKQGLLMAASQLSCPAPATAGYSINYLIEATYQDQDNVPVVLPYFNSANISQPLPGQGGNGAAQATERQGMVVLTVKAGAAATTGTQTTPAADAGYVGMAVVTVANGALTIVASNISIVPGIPSVSNLMAMIQTGALNTAKDTGAVNALSIALSPPIAAYVPGMMLSVEAIIATNTGAATIAANGLDALPIYSPAGVLQGGELFIGTGAILRVNAAGNGAVLIQTTGGNLPVKNATQSNHAAAYGQLAGLFTPLSYSQTITITSNTTLTAAQSGMYLDVWFVSAGTVITLPFAGVGFANGFALSIGPNSSALTILNPSFSHVFSPDGTILIPAGGGTWSKPTGPGNEFFLHEFAGAAIANTTGRTIVANAVNANEAVAANQVFGITQSHQNVTASRALSTTYTNSTGKPIWVMAMFASNASTIVSFYINAVLVESTGTPNVNGQVIFNQCVLPGETYSYAVTAGASSVSSWWEIR